MKKYDLKINGKEYKVEIKDFQVKSAKVEVNGKAFNVDISYPESSFPAPVIPRPVPANNNNRSSAPAPAPAPAQTSAPAQSAGNSVNAPMPGLILKLMVNVGDAVTIGQRVAVMEAMKMENDINTTVAGTIQAINVKEGDNVQENQSLLVVG